MAFGRMTDFPLSKISTPWASPLRECWTSLSESQVYGTQVEKEVSCGEIREGSNLRRKEVGIWELCLSFRPAVACGVICKDWAANVESLMMLTCSDFRGCCEDPLGA